MKANRRREAESMVLVAASVLGAGALIGTGCGPAGEVDADTCATATYEDVSNLEYGIIGTVQDDLGIPVAGARVFIPGTQVEMNSDANGRFAIAAAELGGETQVQLWAEKDGYPDKVQEIELPTDKIADVVLAMKPFTETDMLDVQEGGSVSDGTAIIYFEPNSLMYQDTGEPVLGNAEISVVTYRPDNVGDMKAAPGSLYGSSPIRDDDGNLVLGSDGNPTYQNDPILTFGMVDVGMWQNGRRLELVEGKPAYVLLQNITEGEHYQSEVEAFNEEYGEEIGRYVEPTIPLWHFNYDSAMWDLVEDYEWNFEQGDEGGYVTIGSYVPEFSPANPDRPPVVCTNSIDVVNPVETCVCKAVMHKNDVEGVRGAAMTLMSRARSYTYLVRTCSDGSGSRRLVNSTMVTWFDRATTDDLGNFCGTAIIDPLSLTGSVRIDSTKTYFPGRLDDEDTQYKDSDNDGVFDADGDGEIDDENIVGFLGDTHTDAWRRSLNGEKACGAPDEVINVECINGPVDPVSGEVYE